MEANYHFRKSVITIAIDCKLPTILPFPAMTFGVAMTILGGPVRGYGFRSISLLGVATAALVLAGCENKDSVEQPGATPPVEVPVSKPNPALAPSPPSNIIAPGDPVNAAEDALNAGDINEAIRLFYASPVTPERRSEADAIKLFEAIEATFDKSADIDRGGNEVDRLVSYWEPQLEQMPVTAPDTEGDLRARVQLFSDVAEVLRSTAGSKLTPDQAAQRRKFKSALSQKQAKVFPILRRAYAELRRPNLWEDNVTIEVRGSSAQTLRMSGAVFASNRNVKSVFDAQSGLLTDLRFQRAEYAWSAGAAGQVYSFKTPNDSAVGYWKYGSFRLID